MIQSYGGLTIDKNGNRDYAGSGGMVGSLQLPGFGGTARIAGAGAAYHRFTPSDSVVMQPCAPGSNCEPMPFPEEPPSPTPQTPTPTPTPQTPTPTPTPQTPTPQTPTVPGGGTTVNCLWGDCSGNLPGTTIGDIITGLLAPLRRQPVEAAGASYIFTPQPVSNSTGISPMVLVAVAAIGMIGFLAYKKFGG